MERWNNVLNIVTLCVKLSSQLKGKEHVLEVCTKFWH